jgi:hypothetical protein
MRCMHTQSVHKPTRTRSAAVSNSRPDTVPIIAAFALGLLLLSWKCTQFQEETHLES